MFATRSEIREAAGHLIICGFDGTTLTPELKEILREVNPVGLILFARNIESPEQVTEFNHELKSFRAKESLLLCVDQEGGRVARIRKPATEWPPMRSLGEIGDAKLVSRVGRALARELRAMNFDVDFAPVLDVDTNPKNPVIGDRSFARDAEQVALMGVALTRALQENGIAACGKHFPGHGDTDVDSHLALPTIGHDLARLRAVEWRPFQAAIDAGLGAIMTAHVVAEALDDVPATLSRRILTDYLRGALNFSGVIVSDDVEMKAVADRYSMADISLQGLRAGVDVFLACHKPEIILDLYRSMVVAVESEKLSHETLVTAEKRVLAWRDQYYQAPVDQRLHQDVVGGREHAELVQEINRRLLG